ncbi:MAG: molybdopterin molybdotransferase MoeA [Phycisphaerae bacterium]|jgi:molybdopterin molybdotransferase|nr:molybdopterin molybdotransferase MoeA [Phycisphaerae bacterium]
MAISPRKAWGIIRSCVKPLGSIRKPLGEAFGYCLAQNVRANRDMPPADRSAMDGYAFRAADLSGYPCNLQLVGEVAAGSSSHPQIRPGCCAAVLTGANIPPGSDTVVKIELTSLDDGTVSIIEPVKPFMNVRKRGEEAARGDVLLGEGTVLGPAEVGVCATVGLANPKVRRRPKIALLCTGAELRDVSQSVAPHQTRNSNGPVMQAILADAGFDSVTHEIVPDDPQLTIDALKHATETADVTILTGGVSVGKYDYVPDAVKAIGARVRFYKIQMKPGKPLLYATRGRNGHIFALPGNPVSVLTSMYAFVLPALRRLSGLSEEECLISLRLPLTRKIKSKSGRSLMALARIVYRRSGPAVTPVESVGSADISAASSADGVVVIPAESTEVTAGSIVEFQPWRAKL